MRPHAQRARRIRIGNPDIDFDGAIEPVGERNERDAFRHHTQELRIEDCGIADAKDSHTFMLHAKIRVISADVLMVV